MSKKNKRFCRKSSGFRGSGSREKKDDHKGYFNCKKPGHFIVECPELQKDNPKKGSFKKYSFKNIFKKSLMTTWDELDNEEEYKKDEEKANLALMDITSSEAKSEFDYGSEYDKYDEVFSKLSRSDIITFVQELIGRCHEKARHMKILKKNNMIFRNIS